MSNNWKPIEIDPTTYDEKLFYKIINHQYSVDIVYEDETTIAFHWINPAAPIHILVIPKLEIQTVNDLNENDISLVGGLVYVASRIAADLKIDTDGYRLVFNVNDLGGQHIKHIHLHLMGGRQFSWPPG